MESIESSPLDEMVLLPVASEFDNGRSEDPELELLFWTNPMAPVLAPAASLASIQT